VWIRETKENFIKLQSILEDTVFYLMLPEKVGKEFLGVAAEDADILVS
jgi:hypothetical protein